MDTNNQAVFSHKAEPLEVIEALTTEYVNVYGLNIISKEITVYRFSGKAVGVLDQIGMNRRYEQVMESYIEKNVLLEDQEMMRRMTRLDRIIRELQTGDVYIAHYRVKRDEKVHYYFMKCVRVGKRDSFENIILAFANEDSESRYNGALRGPISDDPTAKRKILVVEYNTLNRKILSSILEENYTVIEAVDGVEGMEKLRENYRQLSLVLLDVQMPRMNGFEFLEELRQDAELSQVPVIVSVNSNASDDKERCLDLGAADYITKPYNPGIALRRIASAIMLSESSANLRAAEIDDLTGLYTLKAFCLHAENMLRRNPDVRFDMIMSDIENFKRVNERYGDAMGDRILKLIGGMLANNNPDVICGRFGGDRFVSILRHDEALPLEKVEELSSVMVSQLPVNNLVLKFGLYDDVPHDLPVSILCDHLLTALQTIKHQYGKTWAKYDDRLKKKASQELLIEEGMKRALEEQQFRIYFQPKYDLQQGRTGGAEALVRWIHPELGFMNPGLFIPLFEKNGFITSLDQYVLDFVCRTLARWKETGSRVVPVSVNFSRRDFEQSDLVDTVVRIVDSYGLEHSLVHIEVTESSLSEDPVEVTRCVNALHSAGFVIEMDDFGTGYSSMASLNTMHMDVLKLDMSILNQDEPGSDRSILEFAIQLARMMGLKIVQEGVETAEQAERIRSLGCDYAQGYFISRPLKCSDFENYLAKES